MNLAEVARCSLALFSWTLLSSHLFSFFCMVDVCAYRAGDGTLGILTLACATALQPLCVLAAFEDI